jgi:hypothetical protein
MSTDARTLPDASSRNARPRTGIARRARDAAARSARGGAFWCAVALPFVHTPLLLTGLESVGTLGAYLALLTLNAVALIVGHAHAAGDPVRR